MWNLIGPTEIEFLNLELYIFFLALSDRSVKLPVYILSIHTFRSGNTPSDVRPKVAKEPPRRSKEEPPVNVRFYLFFYS